MLAASGFRESTLSKDKGNVDLPSQKRLFGDKQMDHSPAFNKGRVTRSGNYNRLKSCVRVIFWYAVILTRLRLPYSSFVVSVSELTSWQHLHAVPVAYALRAPFIPTNRPKSILEMACHDFNDRYRWLSLGRHQITSICLPHLAHARPLACQDVMLALPRAGLTILHHPWCLPSVSDNQASMLICG